MALLLHLLLNVMISCNAAGIDTSSIGSSITNLFKSTKNFSTSRVVNSSVEAALPIVQDPEALMKINPIITNFVQSPDDPLLYTVTDTLDVIGLHPTTTYTAKFTVNPDGLSTDVNAGAGVTTKGHWTISTNANGETEVKEDTVLSGPSIFMPFIQSTTEDAHNTDMDNLVKLINDNAAKSA
ncbi:hypothetical protein DL96DRAFT_413623 [Flagelloscypha sp. PMI_526]|nr:hypothetical protein DL96DRAFT_413623 [Flagelloscypha sp. PMI_526]